ncbi:hypothetical protein B0T17DRAFT_473363, partial [Bombardia bombarda]
KLLEGYSHIPADEIEQHLREVRQKAWSAHHYPCLGRWRFLDLNITTLPSYPSILSRLASGAVLLDCACCLGQALRQLAFDGAPTPNLIGTDLRREFIDYGFDLFRDRESFGGRFVTGSMLDPDDANLKSLDGTVDIIHAHSFFHLFGWTEQRVAGERMVRFFKGEGEGEGEREGRVGEATVVGRQVGEAGEPGDEGEGRYLHNEASLQRLWDEIGASTGTRWRVEAELERSVDRV